MDGPGGWPPATSIAADVAAGRRTAAGVIDQALARVDALGPDRAGFVSLLRARAAARAAAIDRAVRDGGNPGGLAGVPLAVKDNIALAGCQPHLWRQFPADPDGSPTEEDAPCVQALADAGAVVVGSTHMAEWAMGVTGANPHLPVLPHPTDPRRVPGGSSSGSAVAVATGAVPVALGTDTGGSVRIPAALCGVVGLRPSQDLIPSAHVVPVSPTLDRVGILAARLPDILAVLAAFRPLPPQPGSPAAPTIGIVTEAFALVDDAPVAAVLDRACRALTSNAQVSTARLTGWTRAAADARVIVHAEAAAFHRRRLAQRPDSFGPAVRARLREGEGLTPAEVDAAHERIRAWQSAVLAALRDVDVLVSPVCGLVAQARARERDPAVIAALSVHTYAVSASACPALSLPCGQTKDHLPVGLQLIGHPGADEWLLRTAQAIQPMLTDKVQD